MNSPWRSRLRRADEHLQEVEREVDRFLWINPYRVVGQQEPHPLIRQMINYRVVGYIDRTPDPRFGDIIGDFVENLRSCLDLIAYQLASQSGAPPSGTEFPVFWNPVHYEAVGSRGAPSRGSGLYKVRGMAPDAQAAIERLQPYNGVDPADFAAAGPNNVPESILRKPLFLIHEMRQINFHREPHVTGAIATNVGFGITPTGRNIRMKINPPGAGIRIGAFHNGAKLGLIQFQATGPNPVVEMDLHPTFDVAFEPEGPARGQPVVTTLRSLRDHVEHVIFPELEPFV